MAKTIFFSSGVRIPLQPETCFAISTDKPTVEQKQGSFWVPDYFPFPGGRTGRSKAKGFLEEGVKEKKIPADGPPVKELWEELHNGAFIKLFPMWCVIKTFSFIHPIKSSVGVLT